MFALVQHFPEERVVQIKAVAGNCDTLARLLVVWAHHLLELNVVLYSETSGVSERFGTGRDNVIIVLGNSTEDESEVCLLDGSREVVFRLTESDDDPDRGGCAISR